MTQMHPHRTMSLLAGLLFAGVATVASSAHAQTPPDGTVSASGTATVERKPDVMRMQVDLSAQGKDIKEALANLKALKEADKEKLVKLGAGESSVHFSDPTPAMSNDAQQQQMEQMIRMRTGRAKAPTTGPVQPSVTVSTTLKAEWPIKAEAGEDLLVEATELQGKVKAANLVAPTATPNRTPEEEEAAEESAAMMVQQNGGVNPHEPVFTFISKVSEEDRAKATVTAFKNAKAEAARLAAAAGAELGALRQLTSTSAANASQGDVDYGNPYQRYYFQQMQMNAQRGETADDEAMGVLPGKVSYRVMVSASFALK